LGAIAMLTGALAPPPEKGEPASALPLLVNALRMPEPDIADPDIA
jgi:hypothetical protein